MIGFEFNNFLFIGNGNNIVKLVMKAWKENRKGCKVYRKAHFFPGGLGGVRAAVMAWSNTALSPSLVLAEHSRNLTAFT